jgi:DNA (cytosine-5)-methyltransferase 1
VKIVDLPVETHSETADLLRERYRTVVEALVGMPSNIPNHLPRDHAPESIARYRTLEFGEREHLGRVDRLAPQAPSKTVIAGGSNGGGRSHLHPFIARTLTVRECARLQTFDDDYVFEGTSARQFTQVGNAVPPLLAEQLARHIQWRHFGRKLENDLHHGHYLMHNRSLDALTAELLEQSVNSKPEWIYHSHADAPVAPPEMSAQ